MIELKDVSLKYEDKVIFNNYSFTFESNKVYCIIGKSGCGKTSLLRIISGLEKPKKGTVMYGNKRITRPIKNIFMMHQSYTNFPWKSCLDNVLFPIKLHGKVTGEHREQAVNLLEEVGLGEYLDKYPYELSGGMKQRLALARTLMIKPEVILMDEPLSALDPVTRVGMQNMILRLHRETQNTIIMVTHDHEEAKRMADVIIRLGSDQK